MSEVLPTRLITEEDAPIFGSLAVLLGKLSRLGFPIAKGIVITAPEFKLKTALEHFDFGKKEIFEQSLTLVKKEILSIPIPEILIQEVKEYKTFLLNSSQINGVKELWKHLLGIWIEEIKERLWKDGFYPGITQSLETQVINFVKKVEAFGSAFFDSLSDDVLINIRSGKTEPKIQKKIYDLVTEANKKLYLPYEYSWVTDDGVKITGIKPYTPGNIFPPVTLGTNKTGTLEFKKQGFLTGSLVEEASQSKKYNSAVKVFLDLSTTASIEQNIDGIYISSEKVFDLNRPNDSFEELIFKIIESAITFPNSPILVKLADMSEGMGKVRGALRLLHQKNLLDPILDAVSFARHKKNLNNVHVVIPFVRGINELLGIKRDLATKKLMRKSSMQIWMEVAVPENIINLEEYAVAGIDGMVFNLDELVSLINGFDSKSEDLSFYKKEINALLKFLEDALVLLHKLKIPFIATGTLCFYPQVLEFLVEKGVFGIVVEKYEAHSTKDLLHLIEKRVILKRSNSN